MAVEDNDSVEACLERNITPELLISLQMDDTELTEDILRECLETQIPGELVFLLGPIIDDAADCTLDVSKTLTTQELIDLAGDDTARKNAIVSNVVDDILACLASQYGLDFLT